MEEHKKTSSGSIIRVLTQQDNGKFYLCLAVNILNFERMFVAHQRTSRDLQTEVKNDVAAIRQELAQLKRIPDNMIFPVGTKEDLDRVQN